jgi:glycerophosphoryl diester phosphodiesterase
VWTVDDVGRIDDCLAAGATAIITNRPAEIRRHLATLTG